MPLSVFDNYFLNLPPFDRQPDFDSFWKNILAESKKIPVKPKFTKNPKKTTHRFTVYDAVYSGDGGTPVHGQLLIPRGAANPRPVIYVHDYNSPYEPQHTELDTRSAYFFITLRGHSMTAKPVQDEPVLSPGFMSENLTDRSRYYLKSVYIDVYRAVDAMRLVSDIDCGRAGIIGKGIGAAAAVFTAVNSPRIAAVVLETPGFAHLSMSQNVSESETTGEINAFLEKHKNKRKTIKLNLTYFDIINFSDKIECPVLTTVAFKDRISPAECVFSFFNHLLCEKTMEVYPDEGNTAGGKAQMTKSLNWIIDIINEEKSGALF
jgi:cephalosporin-C deacetylase